MASKSLPIRLGSEIFVLEIFFIESLVLLARFECFELDEVESFLFLEM